MRLLIPLLAVVTAVTTAATARRSVWDGVYSSEQVERGQKAYYAQCARCHGDTLLGGEDSPPLVDDVFLTRWHGLSLGALVERTRLTMPSDGPGRLSRRMCTDIVAYLLSANGFPEGSGELESNLASLNEILIHPKE